jgi:cytosine/adenosine deaminase-related metal-dependent hydrolase
VVVHGVQLTTEELETLRETGSGWVLCPRSNRYLGVGQAPGKAALARGVRLALGTDSALSAGDLDLWKDVVAAVDAYGWSPATALAVATRGGADVLGRPEPEGTLAEGAPAEVVAMRLGEARDLWEALLAEPCVAHFWRAGEFS